MFAWLRLVPPLDGVLNSFVRGVRDMSLVYNTWATLKNLLIAMGIGLFSPPFGVGYYVACAIGSCDPEAGLPYIGRYILALFVGLIVVAAVPWLTTIAL